jgi:hypothetical protein
MGFNLHDWDFQVLYRGIVTKPTVSQGAAIQRDAGVVIQVKPDQQNGFTNPTRAEQYLRDYLSQEARFRVAFHTPDEFIVKLYKTFKQRS